MNDQEFTKINELLDFYEDLLTEKQRYIMDLYYREDYSLSEIGELTHTSRSAIADLMKRVCRTLENYENKLHLAQKFALRKEYYDKLLAIDDDHVREWVHALIESE